MKQWLVVELTAWGPQTHGPLDLAGVGQLAEEGRVSLPTQVCEVGTTEWKTIRDIPELHALIAPQQPVTSTHVYQAYSIGTAFGLAFTCFKANYVKLLVVSFIWAIMYAFVQWIARPFDVVLDRFEELMDASGQDNNPVVLLMVLAVSLALVGTLIGIPVSAGSQWVGVRAMRNKLEIGDYIEPFKRLFAVLGVTAVIGLIYMIILAPMYALVLFATPAGDESKLHLASETVDPFTMFLVVLLLVCALSYLRVRLYFAPVLAIDGEVTNQQGRRLGVFAALQRSWQMTRGRVTSLLVYGLVASVVVVSTILLLVVGVYFVGLPLAMTFYGAAYETLRRSP
jgi:membrane-anchored glycerophosphoryl diester phosphodiesterase (GDPDase)